MGIFLSRILHLKDVENYPTEERSPFEWEEGRKRGNKFANDIILSSAGAQPGNHPTSTKNAFKKLSVQTGFSNREDVVAVSVVSFFYSFLLRIQFVWNRNQRRFAMFNAIAYALL
jgi:hypothetical protein